MSTSQVTCSSRSCVTSSSGDISSGVSSGTFPLCSTNVVWTHLLSDGGVSSLGTHRRTMSLCDVETASSSFWRVTSSMADGFRPPDWCNSTRDARHRNTAVSRCFIFFTFTLLPCSLRNDRLVSSKCRCHWLCRSGFSLDKSKLRAGRSVGVCTGSSVPLVWTILHNAR